MRPGRRLCDLQEGGGRLRRSVRVQRRENDDDEADDRKRRGRAQ